MDVYFSRKFNISNKWYFKYFVFRPLLVSSFPLYKIIIFFIFTLSNFILLFNIILINIISFIRSSFSYTKNCSKPFILFVNSPKSLDLISQFRIHFSTFISTNTRFLSIYHFASYISFKNKFVFLLVSCYIIIRYRSNKNLLLNFYDLFYLFCFLKFIRQNRTSTFYICNHHDRWTYLLSIVIPDNKYRIVQHGYVDTNLNLPYKLNRPDKVYILDNYFKNTFNHFFASKDIDYIKFSYSLNFDTSLYKSKTTLLLISSFEMYDDELYFLNNYKSLNYTNIIFKKHPLYSYNLNLLPSFVKIASDNEFPFCDIVVHSGSYLAFEYSSNGIKISNLKHSN